MCLAWDITNVPHEVDPLLGRLCYCLVSVAAQNFGHDHKKIQSLYSSVYSYLKIHVQLGNYILCHVAIQPCTEVSHFTEANQKVLLPCFVFKPGGRQT